MGTEKTKIWVSELGSARLLRQCEWRRVRRYQVQV